MNESIYKLVNTIFDKNNLPLDLLEMCMEYLHRYSALEYEEIFKYAMYEICELIEVSWNIYNVRTQLSKPNTGHWSFGLFPTMADSRDWERNLMGKNERLMKRVFCIKCGNYEKITFYDPYHFKVVDSRRNTRYIPYFFSRKMRLSDELFCKESFSCKEFKKQIENEIVEEEEPFLITEDDNYIVYVNEENETFYLQDVLKNEELLEQWQN